MYGKEVQTTKEGQYTVLTIKDISDMEEKFVITSDNFSLSYSIFSYGNQAMNTSNADLKNLMNAMYAYNTSLKS